MTANERYLRADQEWRLARAKAIVKHRGEGSDLVIAALADVETEELVRVRLDALVEADAEALAMNKAIADSHMATARAYDWMREARA